MDDYMDSQPSYVRKIYELTVRGELHGLTQSQILSVLYAAKQEWITELQTQLCVPYRVTFDANPFLLMCRMENQMVLVPKFQFDENGKLRAAVARINDLFDAVENPYRAAGWWFTPRLELGKQRARVSPANCIDVVPDRVLVECARLWIRTLESAA